jgi:probable F420-dependent oxidoreductase
VADGFLVHAFSTEKYLREVTVPALDRGRLSAGRSREDFEISLPLMVVTGRDSSELALAARPVRKQLAFYASTPAYLPVLEMHGWGEAHVDLHRMSKEGKWDSMADVFDDTMLGAFAVVGEPGSIGAEVSARYGGLVDRVSPAFPYDVAEAARSEVLSGLLAA